MTMPTVSATPDLRTILRLALPALGALAAEPLYVLGDTAIVGHVNTQALAGLALGGLLLSETLGFVTVLEYGATAKVSRLFGAGQRARGARRRRAGDLVRARARAARARS